MKRSFTIWAAALALGSAPLGSLAFAQNQTRAADARQILTSAAAEGKYTFILFYKDRGAATRKMAQTMKRHLADRGDEATIAYVDATHPTQRALVDRYKVGRAPMPLAISVAPNGAVTGLYAAKISDRQIADAFVTPKMAQCMKSMQDGRLVFVCVCATADATLPQGVRDFRADPQFKGRADVVSIRADDPAETDFLEQLKIDPQSVRDTTTAFLAPPAVLVGKYGPSATKKEIAAALHAAGKCCNDPNCKHNHGHKAH